MSALKWGLIASLCLLMLGTAPSTPAEEKPLTDASYWMKRKLELSQDVLQGLALEDYEKISEAARTMDKLNAIESFVRGRNESYKAQLDMFRYANKALDQERREAESGRGDASVQPVDAELRELPQAIAGRQMTSRRVRTA